MQEIELVDITPDPNQPRKYYDEQALTELAESIRESGVLQPILVRPNPNGSTPYLLVCGERRYRASIYGGKFSIPAIIRELSDEEALQLQIVENLQRKDVHPMEEAVAFKSFMEGKNWSVDEVAKRVGKSDFYVRQRIKLNHLIEPFQQLFFQNKMTIKTALQIAATEAKIQQQIFEEEVDEDDLKNDRFVLEIGNWAWSKYHARLNNASFDLRDETLIPYMGSCLTCQFNSSVSNLFPDESENVKCSNIKCFSLKTAKAFEINLKIAQEDPTVVLVCSDYNPDKETKSLISKIEGVLDRSKFEEEDEPEKPEWEDYEGNNDTREEDQAEFEDAIEEYQEDLAKWKEKVASGAFIKAFVVGGSSKGKYIYIKLNKSIKASTSSTAETGTADVSTEITLAEIDAEIERIKEKERRSKQIDENKIWDDIKGHFNPHANASVLKEELNDLERRAIAAALYMKLNYTRQREFRKLFDCDDPLKIKTVDTTTFNQMCRFYMLDVLPPTAIYSGFNDHTKLALEVANKYFPGLVLQAEDNIKLKADKRIAKVEARIKELQDQKKKLKAKK